MTKKLLKIYETDITQELESLETIIKFPKTTSSFHESNVLVKNLKHNIKKDNDDGNQDSIISIFNYTISKLVDIRNEINGKWSNVFKDLNNYNVFCAVEKLNNNKFILIGYNNKETTNNILTLPKNTLYKFNINQVDTAVEIIQEANINDSLILNSYIMCQDSFKKLLHKKILVNNKITESQDLVSMTAYYSSNIFSFSGRRKKLIMSIPLKNNGELSLEFQLFISTENGWEEIVDFDRDIDNNGKLLLTMVLDKNFPQLVIPNLGTHSIEDKNPVIKLVVAAQYLSSFTEIEYESVVFKVISYDNKNIIVSNDNGEIDHLNLFWPFGFIPEIGNQLNIGSHEIWDKHCESLQVKIGWKDVPLDLKKLYEIYEQNIDHDSFKALVNLNFPKNKVKKIISLFSSNVDETLSNDNLIIKITNSVNSNNFCTVININANDCSSFEIESHSDNLDFLNLKLIEPQNFALGHAVYDQLIIDEIIENNNRKNKKSWFKKKDDIPKITISKYEKPFTPQIEDIFIDFVLVQKDVSASSLNFKIDDTITQLYPTDCKDLQFDECLIIQVKHIVESMSFFFDIKHQDNFQFSSMNEIKVYVGNLFTWNEIQEDQIHDQTSGLSISGIISLNLKDQCDKSSQFIKIVSKKVNKHNYNNILNIIENPIYAFVEKMDANNDISMNEDLYLSECNLITTWGGELAVHDEIITINCFHNNDNKCITRYDIIKFLMNKYNLIQEIQINKRNTYLDFHIYFPQYESSINYFLVNDIFKDIKDKLKYSNNNIQLFIVTNY